MWDVPLCIIVYQFDSIEQHILNATARIYSLEAITKHSQHSKSHSSHQAYYELELRGCTAASFISLVCLGILALCLGTTAVPLSSCTD